MKSRLLLLITGVSSLFLAFLLLQSVADTAVQASEISANKRLHQAKQASSAVSKVSSATKKQRPYLAQAAANEPKTTLLPIADQPGFTERHKLLSDAVLRAITPQCRTYLKNYYIQYKDAKNRGLGGQTTIILDGSVPEKEFVGLLIHECGHVTSGNLLGNAASGASSFKDGKTTIYNDAPIVSFFSISWTTEHVLKKGAKKADFASGYAQSDAFEDFAEMYVAYVLHRPMLRERAQTNAAIAAKLAWMETNLPMPENMFGESTYVWNKSVPWDVTRLPYVMTSI